MNIFEDYLNKITFLILKNQNFLKLNNLDNFKGVIVETPPAEFNFDLSSNICLVLGKKNKTNPKELANKIKEILTKNLKDFDKIDIAGPGFLNFKLSNI
jgi:arginyl-tRNA synthetase